MDSKGQLQHPSSEASPGSSSQPSFCNNTDNENIDENIDYKYADGSDSNNNGNGGGVSDDEENVRKVVGRENFDGPSVEDPLGISRGRIETSSVSGVLVGEKDTEKGLNDLEDGENVLVKDFKTFSNTVDDVHDIVLSGDEIIDSLENSDNTEIESGPEVHHSNVVKVFEEVETKKYESDVVILQENEEVAAVAPEDFKIVGHGDVKFTPEGDSVVDDIQVDVACPGVAIVGGSELNGHEKTEGVNMPLELGAGTNESSSGAEGAVNTQEVDVDYLTSERATENTHDTMTQKPFCWIGNKTRGTE